MGIICTLLTLYLVAVFARIVLSWFPVSPDSPVATVNGALGTVTEPVLGPLRRTIPPVRLGAMALDLSPIIVIIGIQILIGLLC